MTLMDDAVRDRLVVIAGRCPPELVRQLKAQGARDLLHVGRRDPGLADCHFSAWKSSSRVSANNCTTAVLFGRSALVLRSRRFFQGFDHVCLPFGWGWPLALAGLVRYGRRGLSLAGWTTLTGCRLPVPVLRNALAQGRGRARIYGPDRWGARKILQSVADLDCVLLRWIGEVEDGSHRGDVDILASPQAAAVIAERLSAEAGTAPIDLYSDDGSGGRTFKSVAYFPPSMARRMIATAEVRPSGIKVPSAEWQLVAFCYHLLFHKSAQLAPGVEALEPQSFASPAYTRELDRLAREAGLPAPRSVAEIEALLKARNVFPEIDTIGFLSEGNDFLDHRYSMLAREKAPGLAVFLVRDFGLGPALVATVRAEIAESGFEILEERSVDPAREPGVVEKIRGGNWSDAAAPGGTALPIHAFVCHDPTPVRPSASVRKRYPRLDNERTLLKARVRTAVAQEQGLRKLNVVHASDNTTEAEFYIRALGIERYAEL